MDDGNKGKKTSKEMEKPALRANAFSRDLLRDFLGGDSEKAEFEAANEEDSEEIELNLGLSLGGRFGVDKTKLIRSSSIAGTIPTVRDDDAVAPQPMAYTSLVRTSSLPVETEEEWRKRKELQTLRRLAAKRRRSEKQRILKGDRDGGGGVFEDEKREIEKRLRGKIEGGQLFAMKKVGSSAVPSIGFSWAAAAKQDNFPGGIVTMGVKGKGSLGGGSTSSGQPSSQGSIESQGRSSSSVSEPESKALLASGGSGEVSPSVIQSLQEWSNQEAAGSSGLKAKENIRTSCGTEVDNPSKKRTDVTGKKGKEIGTDPMEDMPCVFTQGNGPNGRRVEGILYRYGKGEEVRIMCVCHGSFHSPAEFIKHAGGTDVAHPLKHIVVNPNASSFL